MRIELHRLVPDNNAVASTVTTTRILLGTFVTNDDGRLHGGKPALQGGKEFTPGVYEWTFYVGEYFASKGGMSFTAGQPFLDVVPLRFGIDNPDDHYHVPLLVSPWSFSTYRGS
jgi:hydroxyisourate hydrolase